MFSILVYQISCCDLRVFLVLNEINLVEERLVQQFSLELTIQVLNSASHAEELLNLLDSIDVAKVRMKMNLFSLRTSIPQKPFAKCLSLQKHGPGQPMHRPQSSVTQLLKVCQAGRMMRLQMTIQISCLSSSIRGPAAMSEYEPLIGMENVNIAGKLD